MPLTPKQLAEHAGLRDGALCGRRRRGDRPGV